MSLKTRLASLLGILLLVNSCQQINKQSTLLAVKQEIQVKPGQQAVSTSKPIYRTILLQYLLYVPEEEYSVSHKKLPLIIYLHGGSVRGADINKLRSHGLPAMLETDRHFPFIVLSPLCTKGEIWTDIDALNSLLGEIIDTYRVDTTRIYLTGYSMGGRGT